MIWRDFWNQLAHLLLSLADLRWTQSWSLDWLYKTNLSLNANYLHWFMVNPPLQQMIFLLLHEHVDRFLVKDFSSSEHDFGKLTWPHARSQGLLGKVGRGLGAASSAKRSDIAVSLRKILGWCQRLNCFLHLEIHLVSWIVVVLVSFLNSPFLRVI